MAGWALNLRKDHLSSEQEAWYSASDRYGVELLGQLAAHGGTVVGHAGTPSRPWPGLLALPYPVSYLVSYLGFSYLVSFLISAYICVLSCLVLYLCLKFFCPILCLILSYLISSCVLSYLVLSHLLSYLILSCLIWACALSWAGAVPGRGFMSKSFILRSCKMLPPRTRFKKFPRSFPPF